MDIWYVCQALLARKIDIIVDYKIICEIISLSYTKKPN